ncbi:MAG: ABC transporter ATP-binding protein [Lentisphaeria bacterium]|nr:ABC transporter ATP-binding protein [Lentisphaeria bacterium]
MIILNNIVKGYPGAPMVLNHLSLVIETGARAAVIGPSGCGKSTLLNIAGGLDQPDSGAVHVAGMDLTRLDDRELARFRCRHVGFIFQQHYLLPQYTVLENTLLPTLAPDADAAGAEERARTLLDRVGLGDKRHRSPRALSGGESQRAAVVRALINRPKLLLADEPTGALNSEASTALIDLLLELNASENMTLVMVTHSLENAARMATTYRLTNGRIAPFSDDNTRPVTG